MGPEDVRVKAGRASPRPVQGRLVFTSRLGSTEVLTEEAGALGGLAGSPVGHGDSEGAAPAVGCREAGSRYIGGEGRRGGRGRRRTGPLGSSLSSWKSGVVISVSSDPPIWWPCLYCPVSGFPDMEVSTYSSILHAGLDGVRKLPGQERLLLGVGVDYPWLHHSAPVAQGPSWKAVSSYRLGR